jgi:L-asparaginase
MQSEASTLVVLGTGGTIAGAAARPQDHVGYTAGALTADELVAAVPVLQGLPIETETVARLDSCDMDPHTWVALARRAAHHLARPEVTGVVVTHGTDTLEETAYFLHRTVQADKPLVLTAAMRPATAPSADGPQNLLDALRLAQHPGARGVLAVLGGTVYSGVDLRKVHGYRVEAFSSGDAGPLAVLEDGALRQFRAWPNCRALMAEALRVDPSRWPVVDIVISHAGVRAATLDALADAGAQGIVIAGTGNGSVHVNLREAARRAESSGVRVWRSSRCQLGGVVGNNDSSLHSAGPLTPVQARVELMLLLLTEAESGAASA